MAGSRWSTTPNRFVINLVAIAVALLVLGFVIQWLVQDTFFWPEVGIVLVGLIGWGFFALRNRDLSAFTASFVKTRRGQLTATILAVVALALSIGSGAGIVGFLVLAGTGWLLVALANTDRVLTTTAHISEHQPAATSGTADRLAKWSAGLGISSCVTFVVCALILFTGNRSGQHLLGFVVALLLIMAIVAAVAAIITGHKATRRIRRFGANGFDWARRGLICGYIFLAVFVLSFPLTSFVLLYTQCDPQSIGSCS